MKDILIIALGSWVGVAGIVFMCIAGITLLGFVIKLFRDFDKEKREKRLRKI
jgi:hypothetical protein